MSELLIIVVSILHPGDLSLGDWLKLLFAWGAIIVVPIALICLILYKAVKR